MVVVLAVPFSGQYIHGRGVIKGHGKSLHKETNPYSISTSRLPQDVSSLLQFSQNWDHTPSRGSIQPRRRPTRSARETRLRRFWMSWSVSRRISKRLCRNASPSRRSSKLLDRCIAFPCREIVHPTSRYSPNKMRHSTSLLPRKRLGRSWTWHDFTSRSISISARASRVEVPYPFPILRRIGDDPGHACKDCETHANRYWVEGVLS